MAVKKLQNAYYITSDMDRAVAFYRDSLGLALTFQDGGKWAQMKAGDVNFSLSSPRRRGGRCDRRGGHFRSR